MSIPEAQQVILSETTALKPARALLSQATGSVLAVDVRAPEPLPPFPASIKVNQMTRGRGGLWIVLWPVEPRNSSHNPNKGSPAV